MFSNSSIYIVGRSTEHKLNIIARDFNLKNPSLTHIGIGLLQDSSFKIYNISNYLLNDKGSALIVENIRNFVDLDDIQYYSIWERKTTIEKIEILKEELKYYLKKKIIFDEEFKLDNDSLYCSEFVYLLLKKIFPNDFNSVPASKKLNLFYSRALKREYLEYIPVDFFQTKKDFKLIFSKKLNKIDE